MAEHFIGMDVGTGSARAGVFDAGGTMVASARADIRLWREASDIAEQSSDDIWRAVCACVREAVATAGTSPASVAGIGLDATCSLVVLGDGGRPVTITATGNPERNIIVWMGRRAIDQARRINASSHRVLRYVGGTISPEMETPKLLWWTYLAHERCWDKSYFRAVGLGSLADEHFARIGTEIVPAGTPLEGGLTVDAAAELGLEPGTPVAAGLIDAHAGGIGTVGARGGPGNVLTRMTTTGSS